MAGVRVLFCVSCLVFCFVVNQADAAKKVNTLMKNQRIRVKRDQYIDDNCTGNTSADGFLPLKKEDYNVQFFHQDGKYAIKVSWQPPRGDNSPVGYWFTWAVFRDTTYDDYSLVCTVLPAENTSFVVHESQHWRNDETISFAILPLPRFEMNYELSDFTPNYYDEETTTSKTFTFTYTYKSTLPNLNILASGKKTENRGKEVSMIVVVGITCAAVVTLVGIVLLIRYRRMKDAQPRPAIHKRNPEYIYVSYLPESEDHIEKVVDFSSWLRKHGYNVQMDIMSTSANLEDLKELGRLRWGEKQLREANNVFIVVSPSYLNLCRRDEVKTDASSLTQEEKIVYNEITQIRSELSSTAYISSRFIPVLFGVKETDLPFWIKQRVVYTWPDDKMNNKLLYRMNDEISYENEYVDTDISTSAIFTVHTMDKVV